MSATPCPTEPEAGPLPLRAPPQVIVVGCDEERGPGLFGSAHMRGDWIARYLALEGETLREVRSLLAALGGTHLEPALAARVAKAMTELEGARNPCLGR